MQKYSVVSDILLKIVNYKYKNIGFVELGKGWYFNFKCDFLISIKKINIKKNDKTFSYPVKFSIIKSYRKKIFSLNRFRKCGMP